ncbi:Serine/threonine protein kinase PrkC, regulator of stationary phase [Minicystis rosea]|nr:Serine/threonine protein kinase PrkC, regulator of stationary phase [Minicystis rosea]
MGRPQTFGSYQLVERIGVGAMGEVYRAVQRPSGRVVAIKRLMASASESTEAIASLRAEAELLAVLDHPGIAKVVDVGQAEGCHYIAFDFVPGRDLRAIQDRIRRRSMPPPSSPRRAPSSRADEEPGGVPVDVAIHVVLLVAEALAHAHDRADANGKPLSLVHRDVSPSNVLVSFDGSAKLLDFGIARVSGRLSRTDSGQVKGTIGYMSPEQVRGDEVDARSDLYSLGVCLWELVTGRRLFEALTPSEVSKRMSSGDLPSPRTLGARISEALEASILKSLAHSPEQRYPTAADFHSELSQRARAEGLLTDSIRVARYVRSLFPEAAAEEAASREESLDMADNKGGSDLDVFEGLAKKGNRPAAPGLTPPPPSQARKQTLLGGLQQPPPPRRGRRRRSRRRRPRAASAAAVEGRGLAAAAGRAAAEVGHAARHCCAAAVAARAVAAASAAAFLARGAPSASSGSVCCRGGAGVCGSAAAALRGRAASASAAALRGEAAASAGRGAAAVPAGAERGRAASAGRAAREDAAASAARCAPPAGRSAGEGGQGREGWQGRGRHGLGRRGRVDPRLRQGGARRAADAHPAEGREGRRRCGAARQLGRRCAFGEGAFGRAAAARGACRARAAAGARRAPS